RRRVQQFSRSRPLQRQRRGLLRNIFNRHVQPQRILLKPSQTWVRRRPAILILSQPRDRSVIDHFSFRIAPAAVNHLIHRNLINVSRNHAVHDLRGVPPRHSVLEERRDINQRRRIADGVVFVLVVHLIHTDRVIPRPFAVIQALAQRQRSFVKRSSYRQGSSRRARGSCRRKDTGL